MSIEKDDNIKKKSGRLLVFEGLSGTGKTTIAKLIAARIGGRYTYSIPSPFINLRNFVENQKYPLLTFLFSITSLIAQCQQIRALLSEGDVILDRYIDTVRFYCLAHGADLSIVNFERLQLPHPDYVFVLQTPDDERYRRIINCGKYSSKQLTTLKKYELELSRNYEIKNNYYFHEVTMFVKNSESPMLLIDTINTIIRK